MRNENALAGQPIPRCHSPNAQSDEALIKAIAAGDESAMRTLYARHNVRLYHFIARLVTDAGRAEDLVSEVFIGCGQLLMYRYFGNSILIDLLPELFPPGFREHERTQA